jgi:hypothetical protein
MKTFIYRDCQVALETLDKSILIACNNSVNRYLRKVWRITFPDQTWSRVGTKDMAKTYINLHVHQHQKAA